MGIVNPFERVHGTCVEQRRLTCRIEEEFALEDVAAAVERSRAGHVAGKLVLRIA